MVPEEAVLPHTMLNHIMGFNLWPKGQATPVVNCRLWLHAAATILIKAQY